MALVVAQCDGHGSWISVFGCDEKRLDCDGIISGPPDTVRGVMRSVRGRPFCDAQSLFLKAI